MNDTTTRNNSNMISYMEQNVPIHFPFEPYQAQRQMISKMIQAFENRQNAILESPTGSGKSLAILCASLAWLKHKQNTAEPQTSSKSNNNISKDHSWKNNDRLDYDDDDDDDDEFNKLLNDDKHWDYDPSPIPEVSIDQGRSFSPSTKIYIGSRTHKQIAQLVKELKQNTIYEPRMAVLGSRVQYCIEETVKHSDNIQDECAKLCEFNNKSKDAKDKQRINAMTYDYKLARRDYLSKMEDLAIKDEININDDDFGIVNDIEYNTVKKEEYIDNSQLLLHSDESDDDGQERKKKSKTKTKKKGKDKDEPVGCKPYDNTPILEGHPDLRKGGPHALWDIEDLVKLGREVNGCPYYASRMLAKEAEVIFCPYNYLIDPSIRASLQINLENDIVIIDEAHNIESICRDAGSFETGYFDITRMQIELKEALRNHSLIEPNRNILKVVDNMMNWLTESEFHFNDGEKNDKLLKCWTGNLIIQQLERMEITKQSFLSDIKPAFEKILDHYDKQSADDKANEADNQNDELDEENNQVNRTTISSKSIRVLEKLILILGFIFDSRSKYIDDYVLGVLRKKPEMRNGRQVQEPTKNIHESMELCLWTLNPGIIFNQISRQTHSVILTSGTLTSMEAFVSELQAEFPVQLVADHVIDRSQVWAGVIPYGPNFVSLNGVFKTISTTPYQQGVAESLYNIADTVPYGVLAFFSSYRVMNLIIDHMKSSGLYQKLEKRKEIFIEPRNTTAEVFNKELNRYYKCIKDAELKTNLKDGNGKTGAFFFAVYRGKVSEGIDFNNNNCRAVICVGIPFPNFGDALIKLKQNYNNVKRNSVRPYERNKYLSGYDWYQIQGYRALNQALGRCIRHRKDWGAVILLERRFVQADVREYLSNWVECLCKVHDGNFNLTMNNLRTFMDTHYEKDKEIRDRLILEHPEEYYHWSDCVGVTRDQSNEMDLLVKLEQGEEEAERKRKFNIKSEDNSSNLESSLFTKLKEEEEEAGGKGKEKINIKSERDFFSELAQHASNKRVKTEYNNDRLYDWDQPSSSRQIKTESQSNGHWQTPETEDDGDALFDDDWDAFLSAAELKPEAKMKAKENHYPSSSAPSVPSTQYATAEDAIYISDSSVSSADKKVPNTSTSSSSALKRKSLDTSPTLTASSNHKRKSYDVIEID